MIGKTISHYKILEKLGEGGMGEVYLAEDTKLKRQVAIKFLPSRITVNETDKARLLQEAQAAAAINHPNVCVIYEIQEQEEHPFIVMEYVDGLTIGDKIAAESLPIKQAVEYAFQIGEALQAAHNKGIVHRDIKSDNIMITGTNQIKVMDFGLAKLKGSIKLTKTSSTVGTLAYMAPEQIEGKEIDARSDIFSFGVVLYEMLAGQVPFSGEYESAMMYSILNEEPKPVQKFRSDVSSELLHVLNRALEKDPENRYQNVNDILIDLRRLKRDSSKVSRESLSLVSEPEVTEKPNITKNVKMNWRNFRVPVTIVSFIFLVTIAYFMFFIQPAEAEGRIPLAVIDFVNETGEEELDGLSGLLITALEQSRRLEVLTRSHMFDILKLMGKQDIDHINETVGRDICKQASVYALVIPTIRKLGSLYVVDLKVLDIEKDKHLFTDKVQGEGQESVFAMIDNLAENTRKGLKERDEKILATSQEVGQMTTLNMEAYHHYYVGEQHINRLEFDKAQQEYREALAIDSTFGLAYYRLAYAMNWGWHWEYGGEQIADELMQKAMALIDRIPEKERYHVRALNAQLVKGMQSGAGISILKEMEKIYPDDKEMLFNIGNWAYYGVQYSVAVEYLERVLKMDPNFERALQLLAIVYQDMEEQDKAREASKRYMDVAGSVDSYYYRSMAYARSGDFKTALKSLQQARDLYPESEMIAEGFAEVYRSQGQYDKAMAEIKTSLETDQPAEARYMGYERVNLPRDESILYSQGGLILIHQGRYTEAEEMLFKGLEINPKNLEIYSSLAWCLYHQNKFSEGEELLRKAIKLAPKSGFIYSELGWLLRNQKKYTEAEKVYFKALELAPHSDFIYTGLGGCFRYQKKYVEAEEAYRKAIKLSPRSAYTYHALGHFLNDPMKRYTEAEEILLKGLELEPHNSDILKTLGRINVSRGNYRAARNYAEQYLNTAITIRHKKKSKALLGEIEFMQGNSLKAEQLLSAAVSTESSAYYPDEAFIPLGYLYCQQNRFREARAVAERALADDSISTHYNLMAHVLIAGELDIDQGIHFAKLAIESKSEYYSDPIDRSLYEALPEHSLALAYLKKGQVERSVEFLEKAVKLDPNRQAFKDDLEMARKKL